MHRFIKARLRAMMFLQFFIWGTWYITIGNFMAKHGMADLTHWPYISNSIGALVAPFFVGMIADRFFPTERVLGVLHLMGGVAMLLAPVQAGSPTVFLTLILLYNLFYMATLGLANAMTFHNITDREKQFPRIRMFGTLGWILAGLSIGFGFRELIAGGQLPDETPLPLYLAGAMNLILGFYSFTLPHTPPQAAGQKVSFRSVTGIDAFKQLASRSFVIFVIASTLICIPLAWYYNFVPIYANAAIYSTETTHFMTSLFPNPSSLMTIGQMSEVLFLLLMPVFFVRLGVKWMLAAGIAAWVLRYGLFALGAPDGIFWMIAVGIVLHGICYDFVFITGQIYMDQKASPQIRGQAQGFMILITYGIGYLAGGAIAGASYNRFLTEGQTMLSLADWQSFWWLPTSIALAVLVLFLVFFNDDVDRSKKSTEQAEAVAATPV